MTEPYQHGYEFGPFRLLPSEGLLLRGTTQLHLYPKDLEVLVLLVRNRPRLVRREEFLDKIWDGAEAYERNLSTCIAHIRKALDCDWHNPIYIRTVSTKGYRFIAEATLIGDPDGDAKQRTFGDSPGTFETTKSSTGGFESLGDQHFRVESHKFVPFYLGDATKGLANIGSDKSNEWAAYNEIKYKDKRFCVFPFQVGVWHIVESLKFNSISELAIWRRRTYNQINKSGTHPIIGQTRKLLSDLQCTRVKSLKEIAERPGYVLSLFVLQESPWENAEVRTALQLFSCPNSLRTEDRDMSLDDAIKLESTLLRNGVQSADVHEFGLPGVNLGYASWSGISYCKLKGGESKLVPVIVEFELAVQALWWFCHCMKTLAESSRGNMPDILVSAIEKIPQHLSKLKTIGPTETMQQRTMVEAVLSTSRLEPLVEDTMNVLSTRRS